MRRSRLTGSIAPLPAAKIDMVQVTLYSLSSDSGRRRKPEWAFRIYARVAQWIRAFASGAKGRWFESSRGYLFFWSSPRYFISLRPTFVATSGSFLPFNKPQYDTQSSRIYGYSSHLP